MLNQVQPLSFANIFDAVTRSILSLYIRTSVAVYLQLGDLFVLCLYKLCKEGWLLYYYQPIGKERTATEVNPNRIQYPKPNTVGYYVMKSAFDYAK